MNKTLTLIAIFCLLLFASSCVLASKAFIIVCPDRFKSELSRYAKYKKKQLPVKVITLEAILKSSPGVDDPERIKNYLYKAWRKDDLGYVLLVGDADIMPVRYMVLDRVTEPAFNYAFYPSDLYYADVAKQDGSFDDWNAQKDGYHAGYFGEVHGEKHKNPPINFDNVDYRPEIAVGRWPVSNAQEIRNVVDKTMNYEKTAAKGKAPGIRTAAFFASGGWMDSRGTMDRYISHLPSGWTAEKRYYKDERDDKTPPVNNAEMVALLNSGAGLVIHAGHGNDLLWDGCFSTADLKNVHNENCLPVMFSVGCYTARFATLPPYEPYTDIAGVEHKGSDHGEVFTSPPPPPAPYQSGAHNPTGLGEIVLRQGLNGAVAYIGCNTGGQPCALTLQEGFIKAFEKTKTPILGDCWKSAMSYYYDREHLATLLPTEDWYPPSIFFQGMKFMLFGDPTLRMPEVR